MDTFGHFRILLDICWTLFGHILESLTPLCLRSIWMVPNAAAAAVAVAATLAASTSWLSEDMEAILVSDSLLCEAIPKGALVRTP